MTLTMGLELQRLIARNLPGECVTFPPGIGAPHGSSRFRGIDLVGADRVVTGSDYNFDMGYEQPVEFVEKVPGLTERERKLILRENAERLLRL
jgi:predicted TIM-barrel fold metal-dependent hydrolase